MVIFQYCMTTSEPEEYLEWMATAGEAQVAPFRERGMVAHRVLQSQEDPHEFLIIDEWEGKPYRLDYMDAHLSNACGFRNTLVAGPYVSRFQEVPLEREAAGEASAEGGRS